MTPEESEALEVRRRLVEAEGLLSIEGLVAIVAPTRDLLVASLHVARDALRERREQRETTRQISIDDLLATMK